MTALSIIAALTEIVKLINFANANMSPDEAKKQLARWSRVLDFLFHWLDKVPPENGSP